MTRSGFGMACIVVLALGPCGGHAGWAQPDSGRTAREVRFEPVGEARQLPARLLGASVAPFYENLLDDPKKVELVKELHLAFVRFPGGSDANYYDWRRGLFAIEMHPDSSAYTRFWGGVIPKIAQRFPQGIRMTEFKAFADAIGAAIILVPNFETSTVPEQVAWFKDMQSRGEVPQHIELGNEYWIAMAGDPTVERRWPDEETSAGIVAKYVEAVSASFPGGAKLAWQAAAGALNAKDHPRSALLRRLVQWDADLKPRPWFAAVTVHEYPRVDQVLGVSVANLQRGAEAKERVFRAMLGRCDEGTDQALRAVEARVPGKELWITEWNSRGVDHNISQKESPVTPAMVAQFTARSLFVQLSHPAVAASLYFMASFNEGTAFPIFHPDGKGGFRPNATALVLRWFNEAANGGAEFRGYVEKGGRRVKAGDVHDSSYLELVAGTFRKADGKTLLIQNASAEACSCDLKSWGRARPPATIEVLALPDLADPADVTPSIREVPPAEALDLPPYSLARVVWR